mmetsp:Transcript_44711/g.100949  ORF Transcript_44711/g.100949 Transcript_44711/m.100949 type:complete len:261 (+) Transcript_44711:908-1690(+)
MLEPLVVGGPEENLGLEGQPRVATQHLLVAVALVAEAVKLGRDVVHRDRHEGSRVAVLALEARGLAQQTLHQVPHRHPARDRVRVHDDVRRDALEVEGHVLAPVRHADGPLLPVPRRELVSDLREALVPHPHLDELVAVRIDRDHHLVHDAVLRLLHLVRLVHSRVAQRGAVGSNQVVGPGDAHQHVLPRHASPRRHEPVLVQLVVVPVQPRAALVPVGALEAHPLVVPAVPRLLGLLLHVALVGRAPEEPKVVAAHVLD